MTGRRTRLGLGLGLLALLAGACERKPADAEPKPDKGEAPGTVAIVDTSGAAAEPEPAATPATTLERLFRYLPGEATSVAYDRLGQRLDPAVVEVVFAIPPKAADLLAKRALLDRHLDIVLDGDADPGHWLSPISLGFTLPAGKDPFFLRPLTKPAAELAPLLSASFNHSEVGGPDGDISVWLPTGSFPWKIAIFADEGLAAFIPLDAVGSGVDPLIAATKLENSEVETQLLGVLGPDPSLELVLVSAQPMVHFDVDQPIAQVQFGLRKLGGGYEGQIVLAPSGDVDAAVAQLRARKHPEENLQVQALLAAVEFVPERGGVVGRLALEPDQVKHFVNR
jgi:hypothetical protein